ncbi:extracellular solute-binding protein [Hoeflea prorocentri]|uniref:Extracellular solute-binding protein n=1 Tax=Hoeflea prorocentri TaxID=1922333 RepID=A0A9X3ZJQ2_9HYPH|nr:extracellular solute-binding protein [Hoeflea prorocentri]MCY6383040.1 extracellular solute-binding protein [Hoeflea prorocentri]MDA5400840.1 extracellular solute-binding protein [Hoeflea prorocentri]
MTKEELIQTIELLERLRNLKHLWVEEPISDPLMVMSLFLMKRHLMGYLTTPTSLAQAAEVPYTTATRRVAQMRNQGLIDLRPRTKSGRSFSVHPSPKLIAKMTSLLMATQSAVAISGTAKVGSRRSRRPAGRDFIGAPPIASNSLGFGNGLEILVVEDPAYSFGKPLRRELNYLMGGQARFHEASIDSLRQKILDNSELPQSRYDVVAVDLPMIAEFAQRGVLAPLDDVAGDSQLNSSDFVSSAWRGTVFAGNQYGIPILINPQLLFYRKDLFADLNIPPPHTTAQLLEAARVLHRPSIGQYGVSWTAARGGPVGQAFIQFLADFGQPVFQLDRSVGGFQTSRLSNKALKPLINTDRGHLAARFMIDLLAVSAPDVLSMGWDGQVDLLREGKVAIAYEWASREAQLNGFAAARELDYLPHPRGAIEGDRQPRSSVAPIGGFAFGIPSNIAPNRLRTAWNAIEWISSPEVIKLLVQHGGHVTPRLSVGSDPDVQQLSPMITAVDQMARRGQIRLWPRPPVSSFSSVVSILGEEIHDMLSGKQSISTTLQRSQERADQLS